MKIIKLKKNKKRKMKNKNFIFLEIHKRFWSRFLAED